MTESTPHLMVLDPAERAELTRLTKYGPGGGEAKVIMSLLPAPQEGQYVVVPGLFVGRFALQSGRVLDISSKLIGPSDLPNVLRTAGYLPSRLDDSPTPGQHGWGIVDALAFALATEISSLLGHGLSKGYHQRRFRSPPFPGTVDIREHLSRHAARPDKLVTVARRLTTDIPRNSALAAATGILLRLPLHPEARGRLRRVAAAMASISAPPMSTSQVEGLIGEHRQARYDPALKLSALVLAGRRVASSGAGISGASVLFSLAKVWEAFVLAWARYNNPGLRVEAHGFDLLDDRPDPRAQADVVVFKDNQPTVLYDAKYKKSGPVPATNDIYQMVTYCERLGLSKANLVYPGAGKSSTARMGARTITTIRLDAAWTTKS